MLSYYQVKGCKKANNIEGLDYLIVLMGFYGTVFWIIKAIAITCWTVRSRTCNTFLYNYLWWTVLKDIHFPFFQLFQIYLFLQISNVGAIIEQDRFKKEKAIYFLVPFLMMSSVAIFANLIISEYTYYVEDLAKNAKFSTVVEVIYATGSPLSLGFSLHMFIHLYIVYNHLRRYKHVFVSRSEDGPFGIDEETSAVDNSKQ